MGLKLCPVQHSVWSFLCSICRLSLQPNSCHLFCFANPFLFSEICVQCVFTHDISASSVKEFCRAFIMVVLNNGRSINKVLFQGIKQAKFILLLPTFGQVL